MAKKSKGSKSAKPIKDLKPGEDTSESVKGGNVPSAIQIDGSGLAKKVAKALNVNRTTPPMQ